MPGDVHYGVHEARHCGLAGEPPRPAVPAESVRGRARAAGARGGGPAQGSLTHFMRHKGATMLQTWIHRIKPDRESRLREWLAELTWRSGEVRESLVAAGIRYEQAFVLSTADGPLLLYVSEMEDRARAAKAYDVSSLPIDLEHRQVMQECIEETLADLPLYDVST